MIGFIHVTSDDGKPHAIHWSEIRTIKAVRPQQADFLTLIVFGADRRDVVFVELEHTDVCALVDEAQREDIAMRREMRIREAA